MVPWHASPCQGRVPPQRAGGPNRGGRPLGAPALFDDDAWCRARRGAGHLFPDALGHVPIDAGALAVGLRDDDGVAAVGGLADGDVERQFAEKLSAEPLRLQACAAMAEDVAAAA